ncbi:urea amidolyase associated protein UAAP1 [uncultured Endozoicomonas sp.]|uniref:urea amidolyase associated protein UAAP1 n=1 Tax=uncultured Endozoicomonas sp. TaxID=432652 RepID=UPI0026204370|nr:urea amidolyase associated protein UAAP1 [uncultured Endozoicomonas sp.]
MTTISNPEVGKPQYKTTIPSGSHWSLTVRRGMQLKLTDLTGGANVGMLFYNPMHLEEKYNAPDTLKCQHTFKLTRGNCLYSDMGRIFCSIVDDSFGWHETLCGNSHGEHITEKWGQRNYQQDRNQWHQNGYDSFLVELAKYGLKRTALASNINWFSEVSVSDDGSLSLSRQSRQGDNVSLRFEMDTLVVLHTCPHPLNDAESYPQASVGVEISRAAPVGEDDFCQNHCAENRRGFDNNALYHLGV